MGKNQWENGELKKLRKLMTGIGPLKRISTRSKVRFQWNSNKQHTRKCNNLLTQCNSPCNIHKFQCNKLNRLKFLPSNTNNLLNSNNTNNLLSSNNTNNLLNNKHTNNLWNNNINSQSNSNINNPFNQCHLNQCLLNNKQCLNKQCLNKQCHLNQCPPNNNQCLLLNQCLLHNKCLLHQECLLNNNINNPQCNSNQCNLLLLCNNNLCNSKIGMPNHQLKVGINNKIINLNINSYKVIIRHNQVDHSCMFHFSLSRCFRLNILIKKSLNL